MSILSNAREELKRVNFDPQESLVILALLNRFLETWNSGGAAHVAQEVFNRLLTRKPLSPLTGEDDEWFNPDGGDLLQNKRCGSVFKTLIAIPHLNYLPGTCYDIDPGVTRITFPYYPKDSRIPSPIMEVKTNDRTTDEGTSGEAFTTSK